MDFIINTLVFPAFGFILTTIIGMAARKVSQKYGLEIEETYIKAAVHYAEEFARKYYNETKEKLPSSAKLDAAIEYLQPMIPQAKADAYKAQLKKRIESKVGEILHIDYPESSTAPGVGGR